MDSPALAAFVAVADTDSFSRAADQLQLTQPAVSKRIAALEHALGARLFNRIGRRISLTEAGQALLPRARQLLADLDDAGRVVQNLSDRVAGRLHLGTSHHIGLHRLAPILRTFIHRYPEVDLQLRFMGSEAVCQAVDHGDLEVGVVTLPLEPPANLVVNKVWQDPLDIVVARDHPFSKKAGVSAAVLTRQPAILPGAGTFTRDLVERTLARSHVQARVTMETNYLETIKMLVTVGLGWSALPRTMLDKELHAVKVSGVTLNRALGTVHHRERVLTNAATALLELF